jgi:ribonuclease Z
MVENLPVKQLTHRNLTIEGYSRAAVQTYWRIPELKIGLDLGAQPWSFMGTPNWFISHTHLDHVAALPVYVARRRMMKMEPPVIYAPTHSIDLIHQLLRSFSRLDRSRLPCELVAVEPGDEIRLSRELLVTVTPTFHTVPSVGFCVWECRTKLKSEYTDLSGHEIRDLRYSGVEVSEHTRTPLLGYLGDTTAQALDETPIFYQVPILISEMTFVAADHSKEKIRKHGHMHLSDYVERQDRFENECLIAGHFSTRYHERSIRRDVERALPGLLDGRLHLWL